MSGFKFRLEPVLRLRQIQLESEQAKLQDLLSQRRRLEKSLSDIRDERTKACDFVHTTERTGGADLRALSSFTLGLAAHAKALAESINNIDQQIQSQRQALLKAERDGRCVQKLRDKRLTEWTARVQREIEATAQELWLFSHTRDKEGPKSC
jgi:flagellar protein FliJ